VTDEQRQLVIQAHESLDAAKLLRGAGYHGFAASRAYYAMFYVAEALLLGKGLAFSKHGAVHAALGEHFVKAGLVPERLHRHLIRSMAVRHAGDYGGPRSVTPDEAEEQIVRAEEFLRLSEELLETSGRGRDGGA
jgi:uncharacterized protein (UPF0332 family)